MYSDYGISILKPKALLQRAMLRGHPEEALRTFFAHTHKGAQRVFWPAANLQLRPSSGFTQGDVNSSKLFTCSTASLVAGLQAKSPIRATVVAVVDDITILGSLDSVKAIESARECLQNLPTTRSTCLSSMSTPRTKIKWQRFKGSYKTT